MAAAGRCDAQLLVPWLPWVMRVQTASEANWRFQSLSSGWNGPLSGGLADDVLPCCRVDAPGLEGVPAALVVDQVRGGAELPCERVHPMDACVPGRREDPLPGARVVAAFARQPGAGDVHGDEHERDVHAHERPDQAFGVIWVLCRCS